MPRFSSIFDDDFISLLEKQAQETGFGTDYQLAAKMINHLLSQATSGVKYTSINAQQPRQEDLSSLDKFLDYLSKHSFAHAENGDLIIAPEPTDPQKRQEMIDSGYLPFPSKKVFVHTEGLLEVLKHFDQQAKASNNLYLQELLDKLINDVEAQNLGVRPGTIKQEVAKEEAKKQITPASVGPDGKPLIPLEPKPTTPADIQSDTSAPKPTIPGQDNQSPSQSTTPASIQSEQKAQVVLKEMGVSKEELVPYDPVAKSINVHKMLAFIQTVNGLLHRLPELQDFYSMLSGSMTRVYSELGAWQSNPEIPSNAQAGFFFSPGTLNIDNFVMQYANKKHPLAMEMLAKMQDICLNLNSILHMMLSSPTFVRLVSRDTLTNQIEIGEAYVRAFSDAGSLLRSYNPSFGSGRR